MKSQRYSGHYNPINDLFAVVDGDTKEIMRDAAGEIMWYLPKSIEAVVRQMNEWDEKHRPTILYRAHSGMDGRDVIKLHLRSGAQVEIIRHRRDQAIYVHRIGPEPGANWEVTHRFGEQEV